MEAGNDHRLIGCDFTSAPGPRKPVVMVTGRVQQGRLVLEGIERCTTLVAWTERLQAPGAWVGAFDLPLGLPRELVETLAWPNDWAGCMAHFLAQDRATLRDTLAAFCQSRPAGQKFAHRATDLPAGSSPSMKWVNPPVVFMMHAGLPCLLQAGVTLAGLHVGDPNRVVLEAYPGLLARSVLGAESYKADDRARQTPQRLLARRRLVHALETGELPMLSQMGLRLRLGHAQRDALADDPSGDTLDAVLCLVQAAWADSNRLRGHPCWGLPPFDPLEGWIVGA